MIIMIYYNNHKGEKKMNKKIILYLFSLSMI
jgi:hypothetical protein